MTDPKDTRVGRREFVGAAAVAAGVTILKPASSGAPRPNSAIRLGLLGCGDGAAT